MCEFAAGDGRGVREIDGRLSGGANQVQALISAGGFLPAMTTDALHVPSSAGLSSTVM